MKQASIFIALSFGASLFSQQAVWRVNTLAGVFPLGNDGPGVHALLGRPRHLAYDTEGNLYIADTDNHQIRRLGRDGRIVAIAGTAIQGSSGDGGPALQAELNRPRAVAIDGNILFIADSGNYRVRVVNLETGIIEPYAGLGVPGFGGDGGPAISARFRSLSFITLDAQRNLLISDSEDHRVRRISRQTREITTFAGTGSPGDADDGWPTTVVPLNSPEGLAVDASGSVYIANRGNGRVLRVEPSRYVRRIAGSSSRGSGDEGIPATDARLFAPVALAIDNQRRTLYLTDQLGYAVRTVNLDNGIIETATRNERPPGFTPYGLAVGPTGDVAIADVENYRIRKMNPSGDIVNIAGRPPFAGDGGPARDATLFQPNMAISDGEGGYLVADSYNCVIRQVDATGTIRTLAGIPGTCLTYEGNFSFGVVAPPNALEFPRAVARDRRGNIYVSEGPRIRRIAADGRLSVVARFLAPDGLTLDPAEENLYVAESVRNRIIRVNLASGDVSLFAGAVDGRAGFAGDGGLASEARFSQPVDVAVDRVGNVFVADRGNNRIRRVDISRLRVSTVAGNGTADLSDSSGPATRSALPSPNSIAVDADGLLYTTSGHRVLRISQAAGDGTMQGIAGSTQGGFAGDGSLALNARFNGPSGLKIAGGTLIVADTFNHRIRLLTPVRPSALALVSGNGQSAMVDTVTATPLVVQVRRLADGAPEPGVAVAFVASAGRLTPSSPVLTGADGVASVRLTMPPDVGSVTVTATADGLSPVTFSATAVPVVLVARPTVSSVITAGAFGAGNRIASGGWIELYGTAFTNDTRQWSGADFSSGTAPTTLGNIRVLINQRAAFVQRISPGQINAVVPDGIGTGPVPVQVVNADGASETFMVEAAARAPALLAPPTFASGATQYVVAILPDGSYAGPENLIAGAAFRPARPGDRLVMYGVGFGPTTPAVPAGKVATAATSLPNLRVTIGGTEARVEYAGLASGFVGLYQLNVVVPEVNASGSAPLQVIVDGVAVAQNLAVAVAR